MYRLVGLKVCAVLVTLSTAEVAGAQIVTITKNGYVAASGGNPARATPGGTYSTNKAGTWRIAVEYGTVTAGTYTADATIAKEGTAAFFVAGGPMNGTWTRFGGDNLASVPANLYVRVRLEHQDPTTMIWAILDTALFPIP